MSATHGIGKCEVLEGEIRQPDAIAPRDVTGVDAWLGAQIRCMVKLGLEPPSNEELEAYRDQSPLPVTDYVDRQCPDLEHFLPCMQAEMEAVKHKMLSIKYHYNLETDLRNNLGKLRMEEHCSLHFFEFEAYERTVPWNPFMMLSCAASRAQSNCQGIQDVEGAVEAAAKWYGCSYDETTTSWSCAL